MRRDVLGTHVHQRVVVGLVGAVAHQGAHVALRVVVLALAKAVVDEQQCAAPQLLAQGAHKGFGLGVDFGEVVVRAFDGNRRRQGGRPVLPDERTLLQRHTALMPLPALAQQQLHGHGVQQFIAHDHAFHGVGQGVQPAQLVRVRGQALLLARAQAARQVHDGVALHRVAQRVQQLQCQRPRARAKLPQLAGLRALQRLAHLHGQCLAEQRGQLGCGHKVAARLGQVAKLGQAARVVAQARRVQGQRHEAVESDPAARGVDGLGDVGMQGGR